jgi:hypothetical protein
MFSDRRRSEVNMKPACPDLKYRPEMCSEALKRKNKNLTRI